jgi:pentapeptide repeat protein
METPPRPHEMDPVPTRRPVRVLSMRAVFAVAALMIFVAAVAAFVLLNTGLGGSAQLDAIRTAATVAVGAGGAAGLWLAARRQRTNEIVLNMREQAQALEQVHRERVAAAAEADAGERRITELYAKAADQLGSDRAPVRLAGMYSLERLAQNNPALRQTVVNVLCAYLRMPYELAVGREVESSFDRQQELQVRLTAQRVLSAHLGPGHPRKVVVDRFSMESDSDLSRNFWDGVSVDLTGATLVNFEFRNARVGDAYFADVSFVGDTLFSGVRVSGVASFERSTFSGIAEFSASSFLGQVTFAGATFLGSASFWDATFSEETSFAGASFHGDVQLAQPEIDLADVLVVGAAQDTRRLWPDGWAVRFDGRNTGRLVYFGGQRGTGASQEASIVSETPKLATIAVDEGDVADPIISIYTSADDGAELKEVLARALERFGLELSDDGPAIHGSWFQRFTARVKGIAGSEGAQERLRKLEQAIELEHLGKARAEIDKSKAEAVAAVLGAVQQQESAVVRLGSLVVVKAHGAVAVWTISELEAAELEKDSSLLRDPIKVLEYLRNIDGVHSDPMIESVVSGQIESVDLTGKVDNAE